MIDTIHAAQLRKSYGRRTVLDDVSVRVGQGEVFALLGPNGAGKTTTIGILSTLIAPDGGSARVAGFDVVHDRTEVTRRIALTGQFAAVDDVLTGRENLVMVGRLRGLSRSGAKDRARQLLEQFGLTSAGGRRVSTYSGGMRRRLDLALSFVTTPDVLFLDEPTTGLDTHHRRELWEVIRSLARAGVTVLLTTQYLEEADELADRVAVLDEGRIVAEGTPAELKARAGQARVQLHDPSGAVHADAPTDGSLRGIQEALARWQADGLTGDVSVRRPTLDDVFHTLTA
ncbi:MAG: ATP-binding cassette domain-containing protein, partial [Microbacterium sp.]